MPTQSALDLTESDPTSESLDNHKIMQLLHDFVRDRLPEAKISSSTLVVDTLSSLLFLELFLYLESKFGDAIALDQVVLCKTFGELSALISQSTRSFHHQSI